MVPAAVRASPATRYSAAQGDLVGGDHGQVDVFKVEQSALKLLHEVDEVGLIELAEGVTGDAETDGGRGRRGGGGEGEGELESRAEAVSIVPPPSRARREMEGFMQGIVTADAGGRPVGRRVGERDDDGFIPVDRSESD